MAMVALELHKDGIHVSGETWVIRELLKSHGGKWTPTAEKKAWVYPFDMKVRLLEMLKGAKEVGSVQDRAQANLTLKPNAKGATVTGNTFPVRELLKKHGGRWDPASEGWVFPAERQAELRIALPSIANLEFEELAVRPRPSLVEALVEKTESGNKANSTALVAYTGNAAKAKSNTAKAMVAALVPHRPGNDVVVHARTEGNNRILEVAKKKNVVKTKKNGTRTEIGVDKKVQRTMCKKTGKHVETKAVTKKRKVTETEDQIIETATIVVKRIRQKTKATAISPADEKRSAILVRVRGREGGR